MAEVRESHARASTLAELLGRSDHLLALLYGQWAYHCLRAEHRLALSYAKRLEKWGETRHDAIALMLGHFAHAATTLWLGNFVDARAIFEQCRGMDDAGYRAAYEAAARSRKPRTVGREAVRACLLRSLHVGFCSFGRVVVRFL